MWLSSGRNDECSLPHSILVLALCVVVQQLQKTLAFFIPFLCATFLSTIWKESILETTESDLWIWIFQQIHPPSAPTNQRKHCKCPGQDLPCSASAHDGLCCCIDMNFPNSITRVITQQNDDRSEKDFIDHQIQAAVLSILSHYLINKCARSVKIGQDVWSSYLYEQCTLESVRLMEGPVCTFLQHGYI